MTVAGVAFFSRFSRCRVWKELLQTREPCKGKIRIGDTLGYGAAGTARGCKGVVSDSQFFTLRALCPDFDVQIFSQRRELPFCYFLLAACRWIQFVLLGTLWLAPVRIGVNLLSRNLTVRFDGVGANRSQGQGFTRLERQYKMRAWLNEVTISKDTRA